MLQADKITKPWLTDFCESIRIFVAIIMIQLVVVIYAMSFFAFDYEFLRKLSILTLLAQLVGIVMLIILCKLRTFFNRFKVVFGVVLLTLFVILLTSVLSQVIGYLDMQLTFHMFESRNEVNHLNIKLSFSSVLICWALVRYFYIQDQWQLQISKLANARLNTLQAKIKPHFLFNSLNSIASLVAIDANRAETAITDLSALLRQSFTNKDSDITIKEELECVNMYLAIEKLRLDNRLSFSIKCDNSLMSTKIPILCIQPLVENAVLHGVALLEFGGMIEIVIEKNKTHLLINVTNPYVEKTLSSSNGMALKNIEQRLQLQYGQNALMKIEKDDTNYRVILGVPN